MPLKILISLALLLEGAQSFSAEKAGDLQQSVRVRLQAGLSEWTVSGMDLIWRGQADRVEHHGMSRWRILRQEKTWTLTLLEASGGASRIWTGSELRVQGAFLHDSRGSLPMELKFRATDKFRFDLIGMVNLRDYLVGVVAHEMPPDWPLETLKAQAIAARSYALKTKGERKAQAWDLEASVADQVFRHSVDRLPRVREAVESTDGWALRDHRGRLLKAFYHSDCGGQTVSASRVWKGAVDFGTAVDPQCPSRRAASWSHRVGREEFLQRLSLGGRHLLALEPLIALGGGGRADSFRLKLKGETKVIGSNELRLKLGSTSLKSTQVSLHEEGDELVFSGRGFGHGVGLCQWGSLYWGKRGYSSQRILAHYYPKASLGK